MRVRHATDELSCLLFYEDQYYVRRMVVVHYTVIIPLPSYSEIIVFILVIELINFICMLTDCVED